MNGHHKDCSCQPCAIGREIGMDRALELIVQLRNMLDGAKSDLIYGGFGLSAHGCRESVAQADRFLAEHSGETE